MIRKSAAVSGAVAVGLLAAGSAAQAYTVPSFSGPGVSSPGYPDFWGANVESTLTQNKNGSFTLSVTGSEAACGNFNTLANCNAAIFNFPNGAYLVSNESMTITANFSAKGVFTSGSYSLIGSVPGWSNPTTGSAPPGYNWAAQGTTTLLTASLTADTVDTSQEALGFTEVINGGWADQQQFTNTKGKTDTESLWLYSLLSGTNMNSGQNMNNTAWNNFLAELQSGKGLKGNTFFAMGSIATVPLPAAVLLFGSGLMGLFGFARRRPAAA